MQQSREASNELIMAMKHPNEKIMRQLLAYLQKAGGKRTACFVVKGDKIIARAISHVEEEQDPTSHGEMNAIRKICRKQKHYHLHGCWIYSSQIPCPMCTAAIVWAEAEGIVWAWDGRHTWNHKLFLNPKTILKTAKKKIQIHGPFLEDEFLKVKGYTKKRL
jgi:tRNA(Arg) A34 adenosine deaminase TadA